MVYRGAISMAASFFKIKNNTLIMPEQTVEQMNEVIARFMGLVPVPAGTKRLGDIKLPEIPVVFLNYHTSWDWLMPVVERIEAMHLYVLIEVNEVDIVYRGAEDDNYPWLSKFNDINIDGESKIDATYKAVYKFITWYNSQSTK